MHQIGARLVYVGRFRRISARKCGHFFHFFFLPLLSPCWYTNNRLELKPSEKRVDMIRSVTLTFSHKKKSGPQSGVYRGIKLSKGKTSPYEDGDFVDIRLTWAVTRRVGTPAAATTPEVLGVHVLKLGTRSRWWESGI